METIRSTSGASIRVPQVDVPGVLLYQVLSGSNAYGLSNSTSDADWRGIFQVPTDELFRFKPPPQAVKLEDDQTYWELTHFARQCLVGNPNILELLWVDRSFVAVSSPVAEAFRDMREHFFSSTIVERYLGWTRDERFIMAPSFKGKRNKRTPTTVADWDVAHLAGKRGSHMVRMLMSLRSALRDGRLVVTTTGADRDTLLSIKAGHVPPECVVSMADTLYRECEALAAQRNWPMHDPGPVEALLRKARLGQMG
jgi:hypothetical protein